MSWRKVHSSVFVLMLIILTGVLASTKLGAELKRGFKVKLAPAPSVEELQNLEGLWAFEVTYKPMRMIKVDITDSKTGKKQKKLVWYLVYKVVNRPLKRLTKTNDSEPINLKDPVPQSIFVPSFTLMTNDNDRQFIYRDQVLPEAQAAIIKRERMTLKNSVEISGPIPPLTSADAQQEKARYGVATWVDVDPQTDYFTVFMTGFSNGFREVKSPQGKTLYERKTIMQKYHRPGDQFDQHEREIKHLGDPQWIFRADELKKS